MSFSLAHSLIDSPFKWTMGDLAKATLEIESIAAKQNKGKVIRILVPVVCYVKGERIPTFRGAMEHTNWRFVARYVENKLDVQFIPPATRTQTKRRS